MSLQVLRRQFKMIELPYDSVFSDAKKITSSEEASSLFLRIFKQLDNDVNCYECFFVVALDRGNKPVGYAKVSQGGLTQTVVPNNFILRFALDCNAASVILCHNHPSGQVRPSQPDIDLTQRIKKLLDLLDIVLHDHIVIAQDSYYSFADEGLL